jgi:transposase
VLGTSVRNMMNALIAGERNPEVLAEMAMTTLRNKTTDLKRALVGRFNDHHAMMLSLHLDQVDHLDEAIRKIDEKVDERMLPFASSVERLVTIPGINKRSAEIIISEIGDDMTRFPTAKHLASWAGLCPGNNESAGKRKSTKARKGNPALRSIMCQSATTAIRSKDGYLPARHRQFMKTFGKAGKGKATFALAHTMIIIVWQVLANDGDYQDLGADFFEKRQNHQARQRYLVKELEKLGHEVELKPAA